MTGTQQWRHKKCHQLKVGTNFALTEPDTPILCNSGSETAPCPPCSPSPQSLPKLSTWLGENLLPCLPPVLAPSSSLYWDQASPQGIPNLLRGEPLDPGVQQPFTPRCAQPYTKTDGVGECVGFSQTLSLSSTLESSCAQHITSLFQLQTPGCRDCVYLGLEEAKSTAALRKKETSTSSWGSTRV